MNLKIAAMLLISVFMSANTSYGGDLLDRMLGRAGCSSCATPVVNSCGCGGGGLMDKLSSRGSDQCCSGDVLTVDSDAGCGCEPVASDCGCEAAAPSCGCGNGGGLLARLSSGLGGLKPGCGCGSAPAVEASPCGCETAPAVEASACGCEAAPVEAAPCGCEAAPMVETSACGCEAAPVASSCGSAGGFLSRLRGIGRGCGSAPAVEASACGCEAAPVEAAPCGCEAAPMVETSACGCEAAPVVEAAPCGVAVPEAAPATCGSRLFGRLGCKSSPEVSTGCGCDAAPVVSTCGCNEPAVGCGATGSSRPKLSLLDRLRGNRTPRDRDGKVIGVCNDGCNPPCPVKAADCGCDAGYVIEAPCSSCSAYGEGEVIYSDAMPVSGCANGMCGSTPVYGEGVALPAAAAATIDSGSNIAAPVDPNASATEGVIEATEEESSIERRNVTQPSVSDEEDDPVVDPGAFLPRRSNAIGS